MPTSTLENVTKNYKLDRRQQKEQKGKKYEVGVEDINLTVLTRAKAGARTIRPGSGSRALSYL